MGKSTVFANKQGISSANSNAMSIGAPDVCLTPAGPAQVPIPYPNIAKSDALDKGSKNVKIDGAMGAIDGCSYKTSSGDDPGTGKGIMSGTNKDKAEFANCSFDVKIEGKGACRNMDLMTHNSKNAVGMNLDSFAVPPPTEATEVKPPKNTFRVKVVEHLSWDDYDEESRRFNLGNENNKPIAGRKVKIKLPDGSEVEKTTDDKGIIELTDQDPQGKFEIIFEPEDAKNSHKDYFFYNGITPLKKKE